ncbi:MAG TPA: YbdD/YjiX family protein [Allosphingosinicella sp.]|jgi:uncharacterized short protein YbdD (DUF466 family)
MPWRDVMKRTAQTARLMVGLPDYEAYLAHRRVAHPDEPALSRVEFHRDRTARRFGDSASRCC